MTRKISNKKDDGRRFPVIVFFGLLKEDTASRGPVWASAPTEPPQLLRGWGIQHCVSVLPLASAGEHYGYGKAAGAEGQQQKHRHQRESIRGVRDGCRALGGSLCGRAGLRPDRCLRRAGDGAAFRLRRFLRQRLHCLCGGGSLLRHNGHTAKAGAKAQRRQQCAAKAQPHSHRARLVVGIVFHSHFAF